MARQLRVEYPGAIYHVMNRGDRCEAIFQGDQDREGFLAALAEVCGKTGWEVHALCLMGTVMTVKWIAAGLRMGTSGYVNHLLYQCRKAGKRKVQT